MGIIVQVLVLVNLNYVFEGKVTRSMMEDVTVVKEPSLLFCTFVQSFKTGTCFVMMCASTLNKNIRDQ